MKPLDTRHPSFESRRTFLAQASAFALATPSVYAADKLPITASFSILADIVRVVGAERVNVTSLVGPDEDAHVFEPRPSDGKTILASKLVVINGLGFEPWASKLIKSAGYKGELVVASKGIQALKMKDSKAHAGHSHGENDPHAWQNPNHVMLYAKNIASALSKIDPNGASLYQANAESYVKSLQQLDGWIKEQINAIPRAKRKVITSHDAFGYLAAQYDITFLAPQGVSTEVEPSAKQMARLIKQIQTEKIRAVFVENMSNPKLLAQLSQEVGVKVGPSLYADALSSADKPGSSYLNMMRHNITSLVAGMKLN